MKKLLIIENDIDTLDIVTFISEDIDFEVIKSRKKVHIQQIVDLKPDIIIIDYLLDEGFGDELCLEIKLNELIKHIPVVLYSASKELKTIAEKCLATAFLQKPFDLVDLENILKKFSL